MTTERQRAANRANAKKATGPKTAAGKARARRNSFRHGLSAKGGLGPDAAERLTQLARELVNDPEQFDFGQALAFASAQLKLEQARSVWSSRATRILDADVN